MLLHLSVSILYAIQYAVKAQTPATCIDPSDPSINVAKETCAAAFPTTECGGRNDSKGNCDEIISSCESVCNVGDDSSSCGCTQTYTGCSSSIAVSACLVSKTYDIECTIPTGFDCVEGYTVYSTGGCVGRNELGNHRRISSAALCAEKCDALESCVSFEYLKEGAASSRYGCQLSSSCDRLSMTVEDPSNDYLWYVKDSKFVVEIPVEEQYPECAARLNTWQMNQVRNGRCNSFANTEDCGWDGGDCLVAEYPDCKGVTPFEIGNGSCTNDENKEECGFDGGDCEEYNRDFPNCKAKYPFNVGNGECNNRIDGYNTEECNFDGGDCREFNEKYPDCDVFYPFKVGDGECTNGSGYNTKECGWDGGDCEPPEESLQDDEASSDGDNNDFSGEIDGALCFSGEGTVEVEHVGSVAIKNLKIGDSIRVGLNKYEEVYSFGHRNDSIKTEFLRIRTSNGEHLEVTKDHLVFVEGGLSVPASDLKQEIRLIHSDGLVAVESIDKIIRNGLYAPFTPSGKLLVNGFQVSSFVAINGAPTVTVMGIDFHYQTISKLFESPRRLMCKHVYGNCAGEVYDKLSGISTWHGIALEAYQWLLNKNNVVFSIGFLAVLVTAGFISAFEYVIDYLFFHFSQLALFGIMALIFTHLFGNSVRKEI